MILLTSSFLTRLYEHWTNNFRNQEYGCSHIYYLGDIYTGEFEDGVPNGAGTFTYNNGDKEEVIMANGVRHGR